MNSLEFIEKQIIYVKENIKYHKDLLTTVEDDESIEIIKSTIKLIEPDLQTLQQIKAELEAWEVVKEQLCLRITDHEDKIFGTKYGLQVEYDNIIPLTDEEVKNFIKALEVEE